MKDRPYVLVAVLLGGLGLSIAVAWYFGTAQRSPIAPTTATETFRAKPGTQRDNARALISDREHVEGKEGTGTAPVEVWGRLGDDGGDQSERSSEEALKLAEEVIADLDTKAGLAVLQVELERTASPSALYTAMGTLYSRSDDYSDQHVEDAFALALSTAGSAQERLNVIYRHAKVYLEHGRTQLLLEMLERTKPEAAEFGVRSAEIEIMRANALWAAGDIPASLRTLESLLSRSESEELLDDSAFEGVYRQAATRLIRLYRETGNDDKAESLSRSIRSQLRGQF